MVRALVLEYQDDPAAAAIFDQYLFGDQVLVAPILDETNRRRVYLPSGTWVDYWTKTPLQGPCWLEIEAPLEVLPLYLRGGAILPYGPLCQHVDEKPLDPLTLEIYSPQASGSCTIYEPSRADVQVQYQSNGKDLVLETSSAPGKIEVILYGQEISRARQGEKSLALLKREDGGWQFSYDGRQPARVNILAEGSFFTRQGGLRT
jgi:alpha-D-xyloside xylohydrolase